jgi:hypothetical protein
MDKTGKKLVRSIRFVLGTDFKSQGRIVTFYHGLASVIVLRNLDKERDMYLYLN